MINYVHIGKINNKDHVWERVTIIYGYHRCRFANQVKEYSKNLFPIGLTVNSWMLVLDNYTK